MPQVRMDVKEMLRDMRMEVNGMTMTSMRFSNVVRTWVKGKEEGLRESASIVERKVICQDFASRRQQI